MGQRRPKVIESGTIWKLGYGFLFAYHINYGRICSHFGDIQRQTMAWSWNLGLGLFKVIENGAIRKPGCGFLIAFYSNYGAILYRLRDIATYW